MPPMDDAPYPQLRTLTPIPPSYRLSRMMQLPAAPG